MKNVYIYGGAFDPVTIAHTAIITELLNRLKSEPESMLYILVSDNDTKQYIAECEDRMAMIVHTVTSLHSLYSDTSNSPGVYNQGEPSEIFHRVKILDETFRTADALRELRKNNALNDAKFTLVVGYDEYVSLSRSEWVDSKWIIDNVNLLVVKRNGCIVDTAPSVNGTVVNWVVPNASSTSARAALANDPMCHCADVAPVVMEYIRRNHLYGQSNASEYYAEEQKCLENYDPFKFPRPSVTVTSVIISCGSILLVKRKNPPFHDYWALPGGFTNPKETIEMAGVREVKEETSLDIPPEIVTQVGVFYPKDPRIDSHPEFWVYDVGITVNLSDFYDNNVLINFTASAGDDAKDTMWCPIEKIDSIPLAFHHKDIVISALNVTHLKYRKNI